MLMRGAATASVSRPSSIARGGAWEWGEGGGEIGFVWLL